jgi:hypothetical protein
MTTNSQPIAPNTLLDDLHPSRFLKVTDLTERWKVAQMTVTISRITKESTIPNPKDLDPTTADKQHPNGKPRVVWQPAFYFKREGKSQEWPSAYLLSAQVDIQSIKTAAKATTTGELIGKQITIMIGEHRKQAVLRISPMPPMDPQQPGPQQTGEVINDTCKKCGMLAQVNPETQRFYTHQNVAGETCTGWADEAK